jgi:hypothetical protein
MSEIEGRGEHSRDWLRRTTKPAKLHLPDRQIGRLERLEAQIEARSIQIAFLTDGRDPDGALAAEEALVLAFDELVERERDLAQERELAHRHADGVREAQIKLAIVVGVASAAVTATVVTLGFLAL